MHEKIAKIMKILFLDVSQKAECDYVKSKLVQYFAAPEKNSEDHQSCSEAVLERSNRTHLG